MAALSFAAPALRGDLNHDGLVNIGDAIIALKITTQTIQPTPDDITVGDVAPVPGTEGRPLGDGKVAISDAIRILRYVVGLITAADFYAGQGSTVDPNRPVLTIDTSKTGPLFSDSSTPRDAPISIKVSGADRLALGGCTVEVIPIIPSPALTIVKIEAGDLTAGASIVTNPPSIPAAGVAKARGAFSLADKDPITGAGEVLRFVLHASGAVPATSRYRVVLTFPDFTTDTAESLAIASTEAVLSAGG